MPPTVHFLEGGLEGGNLVQLELFELVVLGNLHVRLALARWNLDGNDLRFEPPFL